MHRQPGTSGFPTMAGFMGEKPTKRPRIQEPQKEKTLADMRLPAPEVEDEVWEDLDEDAMEECMILATQMCTEPLEEPKDRTISTNTHNDTFTFPNKKNDQSSNVKKENHSRSANVDHLVDSGISSSRGTGLDSSRILHNSVTSRSANHSLNISTKGNANASRFNNFNSSSNSQKLSSAPRPAQTSGKVYNSIPLKGCGSQVNHPVYPGTSKVSPKKELQDTSKMTNYDKAKLEEDILLKQGEISLLRSELKRKEAALEAERLDRCTVIEAAEKRGRDKAKAISSEAEAKVKQSNKMIEKLQDELHFKNREIQELETQCRRFETQAQKQGTSSLGSQRDPASSKFSPGRSSSNFKDRFDFSVSAVSKKNTAVQTESLPKVNRLRPKLDVTFSRGRGRGGRQVACLLSSAVKEEVAEHVTHGNRWILDDEWASILSKVIADYEDCNDVEKQVLNLSIQRLEEVQVMLLSQRTDSLKSLILKSTDPIDVYEGHVVPPLSILQCLTTSICGDQSEKTIHAVCLHLPPLSVKDVIVNNRIWALLLQALDRLSRITSQLSKTICELIQARLKDYCDRVNTSKKLIGLLQVLQALTHHKHFTNNICNNDGNCFISKLCSVINSQSEEYLRIAATLQEWLAMIIIDAPDWLRSNCACAAKLLAALLKLIYLALGSVGTAEGHLKTDLRKLLIPTIRLLHCWSTKDSSWWEKVAYLPHYTAIMGTIINNPKEIQADRPTVDLLCDLYEFDDKIFENC